MREDTKRLRSLAGFRDVIDGGRSSLISLVKAGHPPQLLIDAVLEEAERQESASDYCGAQAILRHAKRLASLVPPEGFAEVKAFSAWLWLKRGRLWRADRLARQIFKLQLSPPSKACARACLVKVGVNLCLGRNEKALEFTDQAIAASGEGFTLEAMEAYLGRIPSRLALGRIAEAADDLDALERLIAQLDRAPHGMVGLLDYYRAMLCAERREFAEAVTLLDAANLAIAPTGHHLVHLVRALRLYCQDEPLTIEAIASMTPDDADLPWFLRSSLAFYRMAIYEKHGYPDRVVEGCKQIDNQLLLSPHMRAASCMYLARHAMGGEEQKAAKRYADRAIRACPKDSAELPKYYMLRAVFRLSQDQTKAALSDTQKAFACVTPMGPDSMALLAILDALCNVRIGRVAAALTRLVGLSDTEGVHDVIRARAKSLLGVIRYSSGDQQGQEDSLEASELYVKSQGTEHGLEARLAVEGLEQVIRDVEGRVQRAGASCEAAKALMCRVAIMAVSERWDELLSDVNRVLAKFQGCKRERMAALEYRMHYFGISKDSQGYYESLQEILAIDIRQSCGPDLRSASV